MDLNEKNICMACKKPLTAEDHIVACSRCGTYYHSGCWAGNNRCVNPECPSNIKDGFDGQEQESTKDAGLSAVGNPTCSVCSMPISNMLNATYCPKCREYHHSYCFERTCKDGGASIGGTVLKTKLTTKEAGVDEPSAEGNPVCSICGEVIDEMTKASYCPTCSAYHHNVCARVSPCAKVVPDTPKRARRLMTKPTFEIEADAKKKYKYLSILCMVFGLIALMMAFSCLTPAAFIAFPLTIVFACLEKTMKNKYRYETGTQKNGFLIAGSVTATISIPLSIVSSVCSVVYSFALLILNYGEEIFDILDF